MPRSVLGLDIGGANLKAGHSSGAAWCLPFALWKAPADLPAALDALLKDALPFDLLAVTMTGELCDCFATKREGVNAILNAVEAVAGKTPLLVWRTDGRLVSMEEARRTHLLTAASNWLALAEFAGRYAPRGHALLIDIGSTTTDIIPLCDGRPVPRGRTDPERMKCQELVYTGVRRTPLCALLGPAGAAEIFATTLDVFLTLDIQEENPSDLDTADGRPATRAAAYARLARMLCADLETCTSDEVRGLAQSALLRQVRLLVFAVRSVSGRLPCPPQTIIMSGSGEFLAEVAAIKSELAEPIQKVYFSDELGPTVSQAACAYALAILAQERAMKEN